MRNTWTKIIGGVGAAGALALSGAALSSAEGSGASPSAPTSSTQNSRSQGHHGQRMHATHVTGAPLTSVKNAIKAKDSAISVERVFVGANGTYHATGTKAGQRVHVKVSKDLKTVTVRTGKGPGGERRHHHGPRGTEVTGTTLTNVENVENAVKAKDSAVTVEKVFKESDGTYRVFGTKSGAHIRAEVSKDLKTVTVKAGKPGRHGGPYGHGGADGHGQAARPGHASGQGAADQAPSGQVSSGQASQPNGAGAAA